MTPVKYVYIFTFQHVALEVFHSFSVSGMPLPGAPLASLWRSRPGLRWLRWCEDKKNTTQTSTDEVKARDKLYIDLFTN